MILGIYSKSSSNLEHLLECCPQKFSALAGFAFRQSGQTFTEFMRAKHNGTEHFTRLPGFPLLVALLGRGVTRH